MAPPSVPSVVVRLFNQNLIARLGSAVVNVYALSTSALAGPLLAQIARTGEALSSFRLKDGSQAQVADFTVAAGSPLIGRDLAELAAAYQAVVVAHRSAGGTIGATGGRGPGTDLRRSRTKQRA